MWIVGRQHKAGGSSRGGGLVVMVAFLLSGPQQPGRMRERLVTGGDAALIAAKPVSCTFQGGCHHCSDLKLSAPASG